MTHRPLLFTLPAVCSLLLATLSLPSGARASVTFATHDAANDSFQVCSNDSGTWVCDVVSIPAWAGKFDWRAAMMGIDADQDGEFGFILYSEYAIHCEPDANAAEGWTCEWLDERGANNRRNIYRMERYDYDADGIDDVVFAQRWNGPRVCYGGTFPMSCEDIVLSGTYYSAVTIADFDEDGAQDAFVSYLNPWNNGYSKLCFGDGGGGYSCQNFTAHPQSGASNITDAEVFDANLDGLPDLVVEANPMNGGEVHLCLNDAGAPGNFSCSQIDLPGLNYQGSPWNNGEGVAWDMRAADLDNDGDEDLALGSRGEANVCFSDGAGNLDCTHLDGTTGLGDFENENYLDLADADGDGLIDIVVAPKAHGSVIQLWTNNGDGTFTSEDATAASYYGGVAVLATSGGGQPDSGTLTFQQGVDGYAGTVDTTVATTGGDRGQSPDGDYSALNRFRVDGDQARDQTLIRFEDIFGNGADQIPLGATIVSATLTFVTYDDPDDTHGDGNGPNFHRMLSSWSDTDTWNSLVNGVQTDGVEAASTADGVGGNWWGWGANSVDVTSSLQAWSDGEPNLGWLAHMNSNNRWVGKSSEYATVSERPLLSVEYGGGAGPVDADGDGFAEDVDCEDNDPDTYPGAPELCDGLDNDCDGIVPADEVDQDNDGYMVCDNDCDDIDASVNPGAAELCDGVDTDCDGTVPADEADDDNDGARICDGDCDDTDATIWPGAVEICDGVDTNCDGAFGPGEVDADGDCVLLCEGDCDDANDAIYPGAAEICDGLDNDCDGIMPAVEIDADSDGYLACAECDDGNAATYPGATEACDGLDNDCDGAVPADEVDDDSDGYLACAECDDANSTTYPGATELCDGLDNDCDGTVPAVEIDDDGDTMTECDGDCDDADATIYAGAPELCDGLDNDCDGAVPAVETDDDGDSFDECADLDCDDSNDLIYPGAPELCDGLDNDCDGVVPADETDDDGDGYTECADDDCDDADASVYPGAPELCDRIDNDCDGVLPADEQDPDLDDITECEGDNCIAVPNADQTDTDGDGEGDVCDVCPNDDENDADADGVCGDVDFCPDTLASDDAAGVPIRFLNSERWAELTGDGVFEHGRNHDNPACGYTLEDTGGCLCAQIIEAQGLGNGHRKFGCSNGAMQNWAAYVCESLYGEDACDDIGPDACDDDDDDDGDDDDDDDDDSPPWGRGRGWGNGNN